MLLAHKGKPGSAHQLAFVHDELQYECDKDDIDPMRFTLEFTAKQAGEFYNMRCPVAAESQSGHTWADVH